MDSADEILALPARRDATLNLAKILPIVIENVVVSLQRVADGGRPPVLHLDALGLDAHLLVRLRQLPTAHQISTDATQRERPTRGPTQRIRITAPAAAARQSRA